MRPRAIVPAPLLWVFLTSSLSVLIAVPTSAAPVASTGAMDAAHGASAAAAAREFLLRPAWLEVDPDFIHASDVNTRVQRFGAQVVVRARPEVQGVPVEGADRILVMAGGQLRRTRELRPLIPLGPFIINEPQATLAACETVKACALTDPTVERVSGLGRRVWLSSSAGLVPAWRVRVPTLRIEEMRDVWVDARTGDILRAQPTARFQSDPGEGEGEQSGPAPALAHVFVNDQAEGGPLQEQLRVVTLEGLLDAPVGAPLRGEHFETFNCCKHFVCLDGSSTCLKDLPDGVSPEDVAVCARAGDDGAVASNVDLEVPESLIGFDIPTIDGTIYARVAFCAELPRARSARGTGPDGEDGWFERPVDETGDTPAGRESEEDAFAEVQVYHATHAFFTHVRDVLDDPTFCLGEASMACDSDGASIRGDDGYPVRPFHITTNVLLPAVDFNALGQQLLTGRGGTPENPVIVDAYQRVPNAAFVPALEGGPIQIPPQLAPLARLFQRPFDSNLYFQGARDFAYDGDVVRHEFTHALVHTLNPDLLSLSRDAWGSNAEPGALNEGWSDYFSSSYANDPEMGEYASEQLVAAGETGLRNATNGKACPSHIIGQVHNDSEPWTGMLWAVRSGFANDAAKVKAYDRALLAAVAASLADEGYDDAVEAAAAAITEDPLLGASVADALRQEATARGLAGCERIWPLATLDASGAFVVTRMDQLVQPGTADVGLANFAPSVMQFRVEAPPGSAGFTISWQQGAGGVGLGGNTAAAPVLVLVHESNGRISWSYEGDSDSLAVPRDDAGAEIPFNAASPAVKATVTAPNNSGQSTASFTHALENTCAPRSFIVQLLTPEAGATLTNIDVENIDVDLDCAVGEGEGEGEGGGQEPPLAGCGCAGSGDAAPLSFLALLLMRRRRRH